MLVPKKLNLPPHEIFDNFYFQKSDISTMVVANSNCTIVFIVKGCPKWYGYNNAATNIPVTKNKNLLLHISPLNAFTP